MLFLSHTLSIYKDLSLAPCPITTVFGDVLFALLAKAFLAGCKARRKGAFMERIDVVNDGLKLIQKTEGLTFGTDALLLAAFISKKYNIGAELGAGSGIISLLLLSRSKLSRTYAVEVQEEYAELTARNAELNGLAERLLSVRADLRDFKCPEALDLVYTNPPYMKTASGKACTLDKKNTARHEICGDIGDFCRAARDMLKYGGDFAAVYRPDRLCDLLYSMREAGIEPKRATFVYASPKKEPSMVLVLGRLGGKSGMICTPPLIIYKDTTHGEYSEDMKYIMEKGSFPEAFQR